MGKPVNLNSVARAKSALQAAEREYDTAMMLEAPARIRRMRAEEKLAIARSQLRAALEGAAVIDMPETVVALEDLARRFEGVPCDPRADAALPCDV